MTKTSNLLIPIVVMAVFALGLEWTRMGEGVTAASVPDSGASVPLEESMTGEATGLGLGSRATVAAIRGLRRSERLDPIGLGSGEGDEAALPGPDGTVCPVPGPTPEPCRRECRLRGWLDRYITTHDSFGMSHSRLVRYRGCIRWEWRNC